MNIQREIQHVPPKASTRRRKTSFWEAETSSRTKHRVGSSGGKSTKIFYSRQLLWWSLKMTVPAQLKRRSQAAEAGSPVLSWEKVFWWMEISSADPSGLKHRQGTHPAPLYLVTLLTSSWLHWGVLIILPAIHYRSFQDTFFCLFSFFTQ